MAVAEAVIISGPRKGQFVNIDENGTMSETLTQEEIQFFCEASQLLLEAVTRLDERLGQMVAKLEARGLVDAES